MLSPRAYALMMVFDYATHVPLSSSCAWGLVDWMSLRCVSKEFQSLVDEVTEFQRTTGRGYPIEHRLRQVLKYDHIALLKESLDATPSAVISGSVVLQAIMMGELYDNADIDIFMGTQPESGMTEEMRQVSYARVLIPSTFFNRMDPIITFSVILNASGLSHDENESSFYSNTGNYNIIALKALDGDVIPSQVLSQRFDLSICANVLSYTTTNGWQLYVYDLPALIDRKCHATVDAATLDRMTSRIRKYSMRGFDITLGVKRGRE